MHRCEDRSAGNEEWNTDEPRRYECDLAGLTDSLERVVDHTALAFAQARQYVRQPHVVLKRDRRLESNLCGVEHAQVRVCCEQPALMVYLSARECADADPDIDVVGIDFVE